LLAYRKEKTANAFLCIAEGVSRVRNTEFPVSYTKHALLLQQGLWSVCKIQNIFISWSADPCRRLRYGYTAISAWLPDIGELLGRGSSIKSSSRDNFTNRYDILGKITLLMKVKNYPIQVRCISVSTTGTYLKKSRLCPYLSNNYEYMAWDNCQVIYVARHHSVLSRISIAANSSK